MHNMILGKRNAGAQARILESSGLIAAHFKIDAALVAGLKVQEKDPIVKAMKEREGVADLLNAIALTLGLAASAPATEEVSVTAETGEGLPAPVVDKSSKPKHK